MTTTQNEMLVLVSGAQVARVHNFVGTDLVVVAELVADWARAQVAAHFEIAPGAVVAVTTASATDWLRRLVCPIAFSDERAHTMFTGSMIMAKASRTAQYLSALSSIEEAISGVDPKITFPKPPKGDDISEYGESFMVALQDVLRSRSPHVNQALVRPSPVLKSLMHLANMVSGKPYLETPFLDLELMRTFPPSIEEIVQRQIADNVDVTGACYWLIGLSIERV